MSKALERFVLTGVVLVGVVLIVGAASLPAAVLEPVGPAAFPLSVGVTLIVLALMAIAMGLRSGRTRKSVPLGSPPTTSNHSDPTPAYRPRYDLSLLIVVLTFMYGLVLSYELLSFQVATVVFLLACFVSAARQRIRSIPLALVLALILGLGLQYIFTHFFYIDLPG